MRNKCIINCATQMLLGDEIVNNSKIFIFFLTFWGYILSICNIFVCFIKYLKLNFIHLFSYKFDLLAAKKIFLSTEIILFYDMDRLLNSLLLVLTFLVIQRTYLSDIRLFQSLRSSDGAFELLIKLRGIQSRESVNKRMQSKFRNIILQYNKEVKCHNLSVILRRKHENEQKFCNVYK